MRDFLPVSKKEIKDKNISELDFIMVTADAYVDHSSFGAAVISRVLERRGYKIGVIAQPNWRNKKDFEKLGRPRLGFLVSGGNLDSMVAHYTVNKKRRNNDSFSPGGKSGYRPDRAVIVYCNRIREAFGGIPIIIGGPEASLRRFSHYDYWTDKVRRSILMDSGADILVYGMGERQIVEIAEGLEGGLNVEDLVYIEGTSYKTQTIKRYDNYINLPKFNDVENSKDSFYESFKIQYNNANYPYAKALVEKYNEGFIVQNPPAKPLDTVDLDDIYELPYVGTYHPMYEKKGGIPAIKEVEFSITSTRGCFGGCNFCSINFHQGSVVSARSKESIIKEAKRLTEKKNFKGYIHDVGGPTANFRGPSCNKQIKKGQCLDRKCLVPKPCKNLDITHIEYLEILKEIRKLDKVKKVFVRSGIRYDYLLYDKNKSFFKELCDYHISGQLRVAPEHISDKVLEAMGKPSFKIYKRFLNEFEKINKDKKQYVVPYFISSHPGSTLSDAIELACYLKKMNITPKQVQDFYPTPGTVSTCMYYTGKNPLTDKEIYVPKTDKEKRMQRALIHFKNPKNYKLVKEALIKSGRKDLIGTGEKCLIK